MCEQTPAPLGTTSNNTVDKGAFPMNQVSKVVRGSSRLFCQAVNTDFAHCRHQPLRLRRVMSTAVVDLMDDDEVSAGADDSDSDILDVLDEEEPPADGVHSDDEGDGGELVELRDFMTQVGLNPDDFDVDSISRRPDPVTFILELAREEAMELAALRMGTCLHWLPFLQGVGRACMQLCSSSAFNACTCIAGPHQTHCTVVTCPGSCSMSFRQLSLLTAELGGEQRATEPLGPMPTVQDMRAAADCPVWELGGGTCEGHGTSHRAKAWTSRLTVRQYAYVLRKMQLEERIGTRALDRLLRFYQDVVLPPGNASPPSVHMLNGILQIPPAQGKEVHICPNEKCVFPHLKPSDWAAHARDECACGLRRFKETRIGTHTRLIPVKFCYDLGIEEVIRDRFFGNPEFCRHRASARPTSPLAPGEANGLDFYQAGYAKWIDEHTRHPDDNSSQLYSRDNSVYELGFDFGQVFTFKQYSVGVVLIR